MTGSADRPRDDTRDLWRLRSAVTPSQGPDPIVGDVFGGAWRVAEILGEGGIGRVFRTEHARSGLLGALKVVSLRVDDTMRERFLRSVRLGGTLSHPNLVRVLDGGIDDDRPFIVMALVEGGSLSDRLASAGGRLGPDEARGAILGLARGLAHLHERGLIHRDLKPSNVLIEAASGRVVLTDYDLVRMAEDDSGALTRPGTTVGTAGYMAPETVRGEVDARSDLWSLGAVWFELLVGEPPFGKGAAMDVAARVLREDAPSLGARAPTAPPGDVALVDALLARDPAARPGGMPEVVAMLEGRAPVRARRTGVSSRRIRPTTRPRVEAPADASRGGAGMLAAAAAIAVLVAVVGFVAGRGGGSGADEIASPGGAGFSPPRVALGDDGADDVPPGGPSGASDLRPVDDASRDDGADAAPTLELDGPSVTAESSTLVRGRVADDGDGAVSVTVAGRPATVDADGAFVVEVALPEADGSVELEVLARDAAGNEARRRLEVVVDRAPPRVELERPASGRVVGARVVISGRVDDAHPNEVVVRGSRGETRGRVGADGAFSVELIDAAAVDGPERLEVLARDAAGNEGAALAVDVVRDVTAPAIRIERPEPGAVVAEADVLVSGSVADANLAEVTVGGRVVAVDAAGLFQARVALAGEDGPQAIEVRALDVAGSSASANVEIIRDVSAPRIVLDPEPAAVLHAKERSLRLELVGRLSEPCPELRVRVNRRRVPSKLEGERFTASLRLKIGENAVEVTATDRAGRTASLERVITFTGRERPPVGASGPPDALAAEVVAEPGDVYASAFAPDGTRLAVGGWGKQVLILDPRDGSQIASIRRGEVAIASLVWNPDGRFLAAGSTSGGVEVWAADGGSGEPVRSFDLPDRGRCSALAWAPDGERIIAAFSEGEPAVLDVKGGSSGPFALEGASGAVAFSRDGRFVAAAAAGKVHLLRWPDLRPVRIFDAGGAAAGVALVGNHVLASDGERLLGWTVDGAPLADVSVADPENEVKGLRYLTTSPDGRYLAILGSTGGVRVHHLEAPGAPIVARIGGPDFGTSLSWSPDGHRLVAGGASGDGVLWNLWSASAAKDGR